jgi:L-seryl-tRNA(Ser) seleniumtransferase
MLEAFRARSGEHLRHEDLVEAIREELTELRRRIARGDLTADLTLDALTNAVELRLRRVSRSKLRTVINATGIVLHTNLGRAPLAAEAVRAASIASAGYVNLEIDLDSGQRSSRQDVVREWLCRLTGAESATVVNNNAAATVLALRAVASGREVVIARGQLVEIGGSFRIPEIMAVSGARLHEVGTTNIVRLEDYHRAIGPDTAALLRVHPSNFRVVGFTRDVSLAELVSLGRVHGLPVVDDVGSGALFDFASLGFVGEPVVRDSVAAGADLVLFSGDKLLGGPQAGVLVGRAAWIARIEKDPLFRAVRLDKSTLAALEATLRLHLDRERALRELPLLRMLALPLDELRRRSEGLAERLVVHTDLAHVALRQDVAFVGGGSLPDQALPTWVVELKSRHHSDTELARRLRLGEPSVVGRLQHGAVLIDLRTVFVEQEDALVGAVCRAAQPDKKDHDGNAHMG